MTTPPLILSQQILLCNVFHAPTFMNSVYSFMLALNQQQHPRRMVEQLKSFCKHQQSTECLPLHSVEVEVNMARVHNGAKISFMASVVILYMSNRQRAYKHLAFMQQKRVKHSNTIQVANNRRKKKKHKQKIKVTTRT